MFDDWVGEIRFFLSGYFADHFHNVPLVVLFRDVGLVKPHGANFFTVGVECRFSYHHPSFAPGSTHTDFFYSADKGHFFSFFQGAGEFLCRIGIAVGEVVEQIVDGLYIEFFEGGLVGFFDEWEVVSERVCCLHNSTSIL